MKKFIILTIALASTLFASAQGFDAGKLYVGGTVGLSYSSLSFGGQSFGGVSFKLLPSVGYQFNEKWSAGLSIGYIRGYSALGSLDPTDFKALGNAVTSTALDIVSSDDLIGFKPGAFRFAPYARYTIFSVGKFSLFADAVLGMNFGSLKVKGIGDAEERAYDFDDVDFEDLGDIANVSVDFTTFELSIKPGIAFNVNKHFQILAMLGSIGYQRLSLGDLDVSINRFGFDFDGNNLLLGVNYKF